MCTIILYEGSFLRYEANYNIEKESVNYQTLGPQIAQQIMKHADYAFRSFLALKELTNNGLYSRDKVKIPKYLDSDGLYPIYYPTVNRKGNLVQFPISRKLKSIGYSRMSIKLPEYLTDKDIHQIHIVPKQKGRYFEICYIFDEYISELPVTDQSKALAIDLGINNFATCATSDGDSFIIDGKKVKSQNQWYNKENARLSSIKDHQKIGKRRTSLQNTITEKRNRQIADFIYCSAKYIVKYCIERHIGNIVIGYNDGFQEAPKLGRINNQKFTMLPFGRFKNRIKFLCNKYNINFAEQEESYTSKASFFDNDEMPIWNAKNPIQGQFTGNRIKRGLYRRSNGQTINADVNGALNILRKSKLTDLAVLQRRGCIAQPARIRF